MHNSRVDPDRCLRRRRRLHRRRRRPRRRLLALVARNAKRGGLELSDGTVWMELEDVHLFS